MFEVFFLGFFFSIWNYLIGRFVVITITRLFREGCGNYLCILLWPHWVFGLLFPLMIGISTYGNLVGILLLFTSGILPYLYWTVRINFHGDEHENYRSSPCCSCFCKDSRRRHLEGMIICKRIVADTSSRRNNSDSVRGSGSGSGSGDNSSGDNSSGDKNNADNISVDAATRNNSSGRNDQHDDSDTVSFRSKHPKSDIVKKRHKSDQNDDHDTDTTNNNNTTNNNKATNDSNNNTTATNNTTNETQRTKAKRGTQQIYDEESLFPISIPEEERSFNVASISNDDDERDGASYAKSAGTSYSVQMCAICLEEYKVGEEIAWSKNDKCHHAFHKDCIIEWIINHHNCPICRNKY